MKRTRTKFNLVVIPLMMVLILHQAKAQTPTLNHKLDRINVVTIKLEGEVVLNSWTRQELFLEYELNTSGKIMGFSNKDERGPYTVSKSTRYDTLTISSAPREALWGVGLVLYNERPRHIIYLPENLNVHLISKHGKITVNGDFKKLRIKNSGESTANFRKEKIAMLVCTSPDKIIMINGNSKNELYEYSGNGNNMYFIDSRKIRLTIN